MNSFQETEQARLAALAAYQIVDTLNEEEFDALTRLASYIAGTPIALITLVDEKRQWFKSKVGLDLEQTPRNQAFCHYTIEGKQTLEVVDTWLDQRFAQNPLVTGDPHIRYYCGLPLLTPEGFALGSLCVIDRVPRQLGQQQQDALQTLAGEVMARLELKRQARLIEKQKEQLVDFNKKLEEKVVQKTSELLEANSQLMDVKAQLDTFLYRASHDLKGPLCSLEGLVQLMQMDVNQDQRAAYLAMMGQSIHKLDHTLRSLLIYSHNLHNSLIYQAIDVESLLEEVVQTLTGLKGYERISWHRHVQSRVPFYSDRERLKDILINLLRNSICFQNFSISHPHIKLWVSCNFQRVSIIIKDNGIGIEPDKLASVFQPFAKGSAQSSGSGLGLYLSKEIIEKLGGSIHLQSQLGRGTKVCIDIPNGKTQSL